MRHCKVDEQLGVKRFFGRSCENNAIIRKRKIRDMRSSERMFRSHNIFQVRLDSKRVTECVHNHDKQVKYGIEIEDPLDEYCGNVAKKFFGLPLIRL